MQFEAYEIRTETFRMSPQLNIQPTNVRVTHIASGIMAESTSERSYTANKAKALDTLWEKIHGKNSSSSASSN